MKHGSLFSGIGGFDLAAEWMGWENIFHCEWNDFGKKVLNYYWPKAISYHDITKTDFTIHRGQIDILTGGFPCQPYSAAGKRLGKEDSRHLWPEMLRAIREIRPAWIVGENVHGLINWNEGVVFEEVQADLEKEGYEVQPIIIPAASVNAPHRRDRVWFVAYSNRTRLQEARPEQQTAGTEQHGKLDGIVAYSDRSNDLRDTGEYEGESEEKRLSERNEVWKSGESDKTRSKMESFTTNNTSKRLEGSSRSKLQRNSGRFTGKDKNTLPNTNSDKRCKRWMHEEGSKKTKRHVSSCDSWGNRNAWENFPTVSPVLSGDDGIRSRVDTKTISFPKWRNESIKAAGNAVVPQVVYQIFKAIELHNKTTDK
jgi:DNA (cytosine-5)-methyltransferase 1